MHITEIQKKVHKNAQEHGWWILKRTIPELLCLLHSEVSEALEAYRNKNSSVENYDWKANFREELADLAIRLFDMCEALEIDLEKEILKKHEINQVRAYLHGNKEL